MNQQDQNQNKSQNQAGVKNDASRSASGVDTQNKNLKNGGGNIAADKDKDISGSSRGGSGSRN